MTRRWASTFAACVLGCTTNAPPSDAAPSPDVGADAGVVADAGSDVGADTGSDAGSDSGRDSGTDAPLDAFDPCAGCAAPRACLRGACIDPCGADVGALDAALAAGVSIVESYCRTPDVVAYAGTRVYEVTQVDVGLESRFPIVRWVRDGSTPVPEQIANPGYVRTDATMSTRLSDVLVVSADENVSVIAYNNAAPSTQGFTWATVQSPLSQVGPAVRRNVDAAMLDAATYVVTSAIGPSAVTPVPGLYRFGVTATTGTVVATHVGDVPQAVGLWAEEDLVLVGGTSTGTPWPGGATAGDRVVVLDRAALIAATAPIDATGAQHLDLPARFRVLPGGRLATVTHAAGGAVTGIEIRTLTRATDGTVGTSAPTTLATGDAFSSVTPAGDELILRFAGGMLFVRVATP